MKTSFLKDAMNHVPALLFASCILIFASLAAAEDYVVAKVGDTEVRFSEIEKEAKALNAQMRESFESNPQWRSQFISQYVGGIALARRAEREGFDKDSAVQEQLQKNRRVVLANGMMQKKLESMTWTEDALKDYYDGHQAAYTMSARLKLMYAHSAEIESLQQAAEVVRGGGIFEKAVKGRFVFVPGWTERKAPFVPGLNEIVAATDVDALFELPAQSVSSPVKGQDGRYYLFFIVEKQDAQIKPFSEVAAKVAEDYRQEMTALTVNAYLQETFELEKVEIFANEKEQQ